MSNGVKPSKAAAVDYLPASGGAQGGHELRLTEQDKVELRVWLRLLTCSTLIEQRVRERLHRRFALTLARFDVLAQLDRAPDGLTMGQLSSRLMVSGGNATGLVTRMLEEGLITRTPDPNDRRSQVVRLSGRGRALWEAIYPEHAHWIHEAMSGLTANEQRQLLGLLARLKNGLTRGGAR